MLWWIYAGAWGVASLHLGNLAIYKMHPDKDKNTVGIRTALRGPPSPCVAMLPRNPKKHICRGRGQSLQPSPLPNCEWIPKGRGRSGNMWALGDSCYTQDVRFDTGGSVARHSQSTQGIQRDSPGHCWKPLFLSKLAPAEKVDTLRYQLGWLQQSDGSYLGRKKK